VAQTKRRGLRDANAERELLVGALNEINLARRAAGADQAGHLRRALTLLGADSGRDIPLAEEPLDQRLGYPSIRFAVYGSLAPGEQNHWVLSELTGAWSPGSVRGLLHAEGWGASEGFPGMEWIPTADRIRVLVFTSDDLPRHWARIDAFEGGDYRRILVPVDLDTGEVVVANIYEVKREP
jgi:gamma-glutamylcyclotransferase (GGCT)/AIG2-like uncharacterized protein YtfP